MKFCKESKIDLRLVHALSEQDRGERWKKLVTVIFRHPVGSWKSADLIRIRDAIWTESHFGGEVHGFLQTINSELDRRSANINFWASMIVSIAAAIISLVALFRGS